RSWTARDCATPERSRYREDRSCTDSRAKPQTPALLDRAALKSSRRARSLPTLQGGRCPIELRETKCQSSSSQPPSAGNQWVGRSFEHYPAPVAPNSNRI